jgi:hypothetical protein
MRRLTSLKLVPALCNPMAAPDAAPVLDHAALAETPHLKFLHLRYDLPQALAVGGMSAMLSQLGQLTELTHLFLFSVSRQGTAPAAAAYTALTASSQLQYLLVNLFGRNSAAEGAGQYMLPAGRLLPQLKAFDVFVMNTASDEKAPGPGRIASCCPGLRELISYKCCSAEEVR